MFHYNRRIGLLTVGLLLTTSGLVKAGLLYVGDYSSGNGSVNYFTSAGTFVLQTAAPNMSNPGQMATGGPNGNLYVADGQGTVDFFDQNTGTYLGSFGSFANPSGLAFSPAGNLYVSDLNGGSSIVDEFTGSGALIGQVLGPSAGLDYSGALAFGPDGNLYIADSSGSIYEYNLASSSLTVFAIDSGSVQNLTFGPNGDLYVSNGNEIDVFDGTTGAFLHVFGNTASALGANALGMAFGPDGNLYVADSNGVDLVDGTSGTVTPMFIPAGTDPTVINPQFLAFETPEPASFLLAALGLGAIVFRRILKRTA